MLKRILIGCGLALSLGLGIALGQGLTAITGTETGWRNSIFQVGILGITRESGITAFAGGGQTSAYQLTYGLNRVTVVASANDSVKLPVCLGSKVVIVANNDAADSLNVFGQTGETINALSANTAFAVAANKVAIFVCAADGAWYTILTAMLGAPPVYAANDNRKALRHAA